MSQAGYTPIQLYYSTTAAATPSAGNLAAGELAVNITDGKLFYKDNGGVVRVLATAAGSAGDVVGPGSSTDNALVRFDGTTGKLVQSSVGVLSDAGVLTGLTGLTSSGSITFSGLTSGRVTYAGTGGLLQDSANLTFDGTTLTANALTVSNAVTLSGGVANGVAYLNGSKVLTTGSALTFDGTNLGIGTTSPVAKLDIGGIGATQNGLRLTNFAGSPELASFTTDTSTGQIRIGGTNGSAGNYFPVFYANGSEQMRLTSTGLGIGLSTPDAKLNVNGYSGNGTLRIGGGTTGESVLFFADSGTGAGSYAGYLQYLHASDALAFGANSSEQMRLTSTGLGIGTSSPVARLEVAKTAGTGQLAISTNGNAGSIASPLNIDVDFLGYNNGNRARIRALDQTGNTFASPLTFWTHDGSAFAERMRLDSSGNLGIGTSSPTVKLDVNGSISSPETSANKIGFNVTNAFTSGSGVSTAYYGLTYGAQGGSSVALSGFASVALYTNATERMRLDSSGNLGLGVTPSAWSGGGNFNLSGDILGGAAVTLGTNWYFNGGFKYKATGTASRLYLDSAGGFAWYTAPSGTAGNAISFTQAMTLDASGNLLVGTTSSSARIFAVSTSGYSLGLAGSTKGIRVEHPSTGSVIQGVDSTLNSSYQPIMLSGSIVQLGIGGTEYARIDSSGNLLVGTTSAPAVANIESFAFERSGGRIVCNGKNTDTVIDVNQTFDDTDARGAMRFFRNETQVGSISVSTSATAYNTSSDYRLKNITGPITTSGAYIDSLNPVEGTWKADGSTFVGLIAHEVQEASRTTVATGVKDGEQMQGMDYSSAEIIANLIAEVKSLRQRLAAAGI